MLIDKPRCNFKNCRFYFDGNCRSADIYENCKLTDLHSEIAKLTVDLDNAKSEVVEWVSKCRDWHEVGELKSQRILELEAELSKAKDEVARDIFAEIEKYKRSPMPECKPVYVINDSSFAELKKKYLGEKT